MKYTIIATATDEKRCLSELAYLVLVDNRVIVSQSCDINPNAENVTEVLNELELVVGKTLLVGFNVREDYTTLLREFAKQERVFPVTNIHCLMTYSKSLGINEAEGQYLKPTMSQALNHFEIMPYSVNMESQRLFGIKQNSRVTELKVTACLHVMLEIAKKNCA